MDTGFLWLRLTDRITVLMERGVNVNSLPREIVK